MRFLIVSLLLASTTAHAEAPRGPDPRIQACNIVEQEQGAWALSFRRLVDRNSSDRGGRVDASFIEDINFALVSAKEFVHTNIQFVQRAGNRGGHPSVAACKLITQSARAQIEQYARHLLSEVHPADQWQRESYLREFQLGLQESTDIIQRP